MHFPNGFRLTNEQDFPNEPEPPEPPNKPKSPMDKWQYPMTINMPRIPSVMNYDMAALSLHLNISELNIRKTDSYDVDFHVQRIKHLMKEPVKLLYLIFNSFETAQSFQIDYKLLAANIPTEVSGKLNVVINKKKAGSPPAGPPAGMRRG